MRPRDKVFDAVRLALERHQMWNSHGSNLTPQRNPEDFRPIPELEVIVDFMRVEGVEIYQDAERSAYNVSHYFPQTDEVHIYKPEYQATDLDYYNTLLHELSHAAGTRNGEMPTEPPFLLPDGGAREEARAELSAGLVLSRHGFQPPHTPMFLADVLSHNDKDTEWLEAHVLEAASKTADYLMGKLGHMERTEAWQ